MVRNEVKYFKPVPFDKRKSAEIKKASATALALLGYRYTPTRRRRWRLFAFAVDIIVTIDAVIRLIGVISLREGIIR